MAVVIAQGGQLPKLVRSPKQKIDAQLLQRLYEQCDGWIQRMHEKLAEEQGIEVKYSTLTRMLRQLGISKSQQSRCSQVPDEPGAEMQHDTTLYRLKLGEQLHRVVASRSLPALLQTALPEVLPLLQSLPDEVLSS